MPLDEKRREEFRFLADMLYMIVQVPVLVAGPDIACDVVDGQPLRPDQLHLLHGVPLPAGLCYRTALPTMEET